MTQHCVEQCVKHGQPIIGDVVDIRTLKTKRAACESCAAELDKKRKHDPKKYAFKMIQYRLVAR